MLTSTLEWMSVPAARQHTPPATNLRNFASSGAEVLQMHWPLHSRVGFEHYGRCKSTSWIEERIIVECKPQEPLDFYRVVCTRTTGRACLP